MQHNLTRVTKRVEKEWQEIQIDPLHAISAGPKVEQNVLEWEAKIIGPADSPYANGIFTLVLNFYFAINIFQPFFLL